MPAVAGFLGALACGLGILALSVGVQRIQIATASESWPTAQAVVVFDNNDASERFVYRYEVNGVAHFNEGNVSGRRFERGAGLTVAYPAYDPDAAVIRSTTNANSFAMPVIGAVLLLFGSAIFVWVVPGMRRVRPA